MFNETLQGKNIELPHDAVPLAVQAFNVLQKLPLGEWHSFEDIYTLTNLTVSQDMLFECMMAFLTGVASDGTPQQARGISAQVSEDHPYGRWRIKVPLS